MKIVNYYSHLNGLEWLHYHKKGLWDEIVSVLRDVDASLCRTKVSEEKGMEGRILYSPRDMNRMIKDRLSVLGWQERRVGYWVTDDHRLIQRTIRLPPSEQRAEIEAAKKRAIYSYNQTDFVKDRVAVEVQFGKYSFIAYDLFVKHLAFFTQDEIDLGIEVLPMKALQEQMSSGPGYYEGAVYDVIRQGRGVPAVPLILVGVDA